MLSALATRANAVLDAVNTAGGAVMDTVNSNVSALAASAASAAKGASASAGPQPVAGQRSRPAGSALGGYYRGISLSQLMTEQLPPLQPSHLEPSHQKPPAHAPAASAAQTTQHASAADHPNRASLVVVPSNVANERVEFMVARLEDDDSEEEDEYDDGPALCKRESVMELRTYGAGIGGMAHAGTSDDELAQPTQTVPSSDPNLAALPHPDLLLLLYHRLARMHGAWRIRSPTSHYTYSETELAEQLPVLPLIQAVHEVLAAVRVLAVHPETEALESSVVLYLHDAAVRVLAVTRSLDTENRVEWYRKALQLKLPTHRMVTLEGLVSGGKQGCVAEFGRGVAEAFLMGEEEVEESEEEEEEEYEE